MDVAKRDNEIDHLNKLIKHNQQFLADKHKILHKTQHDNPLLREVVDDYVLYFSKVDGEKQKQHNALQVLAKYITSISLNPDVTKDILRECKYDMAIIESEIKQLYI